MDSEYDVVIIGGAFSGAATALMLKRKRQEARVLIIEKTAEFDRKVGESTTEVSSCYMTKILGLTHYLGHHQLAKQGLRLWFSNRPRFCSMSAAIISGWSGLLTAIPNENFLICRSTALAAGSPARR
jgi:2-polyprenyl-6-methoxyphenol hydroxylase-like FAD-dependent oxidoreductase